MNSDDETKNGDRDGRERESKDNREDSENPSISEEENDVISEEADGKKRLIRLSLDLNIPLQNQVEAVNYGLEKEETATNFNDDANVDKYHQNDCSNHHYIAELLGKPVDKVLNTRETEITIPDETMMNCNKDKSKNKYSHPSKGSEKIPLEEVRTTVVPIISNNCEKALEAQREYLDVSAQNGGKDIHNVENSQAAAKLSRQNNGTGKAFEEYFMPANTHKKLLRGEKLYLTKEKEATCNGWKLVIVGGTVLLIVAGVLLGILAAAGILVHKDSQPSAISTGSPLPDTASISGTINPSSKLPTNNFLNTSEVTVISEVPQLQEVPKVLIGEMTILNEDFHDVYLNNSSKEYLTLASDMKKQLSNILKQLRMNFSSVEILNFRPGSVIIKFIIKFIESDIPNNIIEDFQMYITQQNGMLDNYKINETSIWMKEIYNTCTLNNGNCSHECQWNFSNYSQTCECPRNLILSEDKRTCLKKSSGNSKDVKSDKMTTTEVSELLVTEKTLMPKSENSSWTAFNITTFESTNDITITENPLTSIYSQEETSTIVSRNLTSNKDFTDIITITDETMHQFNGTAKSDSETSTKNNNWNITDLETTITSEINTTEFFDISIDGNNQNNSEVITESVTTTNVNNSESITDIYSYVTNNTENIINTNTTTTIATTTIIADATIPTTDDATISTTDDDTISTTDDATIPTTADTTSATAAVDSTTIASTAAVADTTTEFSVLTETSNIENNTGKIFTQVTWKKNLNSDFTTVFDPTTITETNSDRRIKHTVLTTDRTKLPENVTELNMINSTVTILDTVSLTNDTSLESVTEVQNSTLIESANFDNLTSPLIITSENVTFTTDNYSIDFTKDTTYEKTSSEVTIVNSNTVSNLNDIISNITNYSLNDNTDYNVTDDILNITYIDNGSNYHTTESVDGLSIEDTNSISILSTTENIITSTFINTEIETLINDSGAEIENYTLTTELSVTDSIPSEVPSLSTAESNTDVYLDNETLIVFSENTENITEIQNVSTISVTTENISTSQDYDIFIDQDNASSSWNKSTSFQMPTTELTEILINTMINENNIEINQNSTDVSMILDSEYNITENITEICSNCSFTESEIKTEMENITFTSKANSEIENITFATEINTNTYMTELITIDDNSTIASNDSIILDESTTETIDLSTFEITTEIYNNEKYENTSEFLTTVSNVTDISVTDTANKDISLRSISTIAASNEWENSTDINTDYEMKITSLYNGTNFDNETNSTNTRMYTEEWNNLTMMNETKYTCPEGKFTCPKEEICIDLSQKCDGIIDCPDSTDELSDCEDCGLNFRCENNSQCIMAAARCDDIWDCENGSDEVGCEPQKCGPKEYLCSDNSSCIKLLDICNNVYNCRDRSDEIGCVERTTCDTNRFFCPEGLCIPLSQRCDGAQDCKNNEDEANCTCPSEMFQCLNSVCIAKELKCNGKEDCLDGSDERGCVQVDSNGIVQVYDHQSMTWKLLCGENWTMEEGNYLCQEYGFSEALSVSSITVFSNVGWMKRNDTFNNLTLWTLGVQSASFCSDNLAATVKCKQFDCGKSPNQYRRKRIVGGQENGHLPGQWTSLAVINSLETNKSCHAVIISPLWVLTSSQCLQKRLANVNELLVQTGIIGSNTFENSTQERRASYIINHPHSSTHRSPILRDYDLALIRLEEPLLLNNYVNAICLPEEEVKPGITCFTGSFGSRKPNEPPPEPPSLSHLAVVVYNRDECNQVNHYNNNVKATMICAITTEGTSLCNNDDGAPLMCLSTTKNWHVAGILSYQHNCGIYYKQPSVFSNIFGMKSFIEVIIGKNKYNITYDNALYTTYQPTTEFPNDTTTDFTNMELKVSVSSADVIYTSTVTTESNNYTTLLVQQEFDDAVTQTEDKQSLTLVSIVDNTTVIDEANSSSQEFSVWNTKQENKSESTENYSSIQILDENITVFTTTESTTITDISDSIAENNLSTVSNEFINTSFNLQNNSTYENGKFTFDMQLENNTNQPDLNKTENSIDLLTNENLSSINKVDEETASIGNTEILNITDISDSTISEFQTSEGSSYISNLENENYNSTDLYLNTEKSEGTNYSDSTLKYISTEFTTIDSTSTIFSETTLINEDSLTEQYQQLPKEELFSDLQINVPTNEKELFSNNSNIKNSEDIYAENWNKSNQVPYEKIIFTESIINFTQTDTLETTFSEIMDNSSNNSISLIQSEEKKSNLSTVCGLQKSEESYIGILKTNVTLCMASIISSQWVLTSYQCLLNRDNSTNSTLWTFHTTTSNFSVKNIFNHNNDIALVQLDSFNDDITSVLCLPKFNLTDECLIAVWNGSREGTNDINYQSVSITFTEYCNSSYIEENSSINYICINSTNSYCQDGAPLICTDSDGLWHLNGISKSFCKDTTEVYIAILSHLPWIHSVID